jgi:hypothetical protein
MRYRVQAVRMDVKSRTTEGRILETIDVANDPDYASCIRESPINCLLVETIFETRHNAWTHANGHVVKVIDIRRLD